MGKLKIEYRIKSVNPKGLDDFKGCAYFLFTVMSGTATLTDGMNVYDIGACGLLEVSYKLVYACTTSLLHRTRVTALSEEMDVEANLDGETLRLRAWNPQGGAVVEFDLDPLEALAEIGRFHGELVKALYATDDRYQRDSRILQCLVFAPPT